MSNSIGVIHNYVPIGAGHLGMLQGVEQQPYTLSLACTSEKVIEEDNIWQDFSIRTPPIVIGFRVSALGFSDRT